MINRIILIQCLIVLNLLAFGQSDLLQRKLSISYTQQSILEILKDLSKNYDLNLYYDSSLPEMKNLVSIPAKEESIKSILDHIFANTSISYRVEGGRILIFNNPKGIKKTVISGYVLDAETKETLIGVAVAIQGTTTGAITNAYGFFSISLPSIPTGLTVSYIGYQDTTLQITGSENQILTIGLSIKTLDEVVVVSDNLPVAQSQTGYSRLSMQDVNLLPAFMGERDVLKTLQLTPGVKSGNEASGGVYVRGGGPDQNLVLLDGATLYNTAHSFNIFSVFNPDAVKNVELYKSGFPARYGGRLSSVIDVKLKDGNMEDYKGEIALGYLTSKFVIEGPIQKGKTSFIVSGRRSFLDLFSRWNLKTDKDTTLKSIVAFYDVSLKVNHKFSDKDRIFVSFYESGDKFAIKETAKNRVLDYTSITDVDLSWKNYNGAFRWNHLYSDKLFSNITLIYAQFQLLVDLKVDEKYNTQKELNSNFSRFFLSTISDYGIRNDFDYFPNPRHSIKFGGSIQKHEYVPGASKLTQDDGVNVTNESSRYNYQTMDFSIYGEDDMEVFENLRVNLGLNVSALSTGNSFYFLPQPRLSASYQLTQNQSIKASYSRMIQFIHLLSSGGQTLPLDLWVPAIHQAPPMNSNQFSLGYSLDFMQRRFAFSAETYFKNMNNIIAYKEGADFTDTTLPWYDKILKNGYGRSYGLELFLQKKTGNYTGWIGYTLSKVEHSFAEVNQGKFFPYKYDKRHDLSFVNMYKIGPKVNISGSWVYSTGSALTFPKGTYAPSQNFFYPSSLHSSSSIQFHDGRNSIRMPNYHRLDLGVNFLKEKKRGVRTWNISIYNAYARQNPFYVYATVDDNGNRQMKQVTAYSILPSFSYSFKFN